MLKDRPVTAIVPARGGSKGLPGKNLLELAGDPLVARAAKFALAAPDVDCVIVSSDDEAILDAVRSIDGVAAVTRPAVLATDRAKSVDVVVHLVEQGHVEEGYLLLLQPTTPLRALADLSALFQLFQAAEADAAVSLVAHVEPRPEKLQRISDGFVAAYLGRGYEGPSQALPQPYALNGAFYLIERSVLMGERTFFPDRTIGFVMAPERSANIDSIEDWRIMNAMIAQGYWTVEAYG